MKRDVAVITGASSGIGRALALALAGTGVQVMGVARRRDKLAELENETRNIVGVAADLSVLEGREVLRQTLERERARVRYLVHAIGTVDPVSPLAQISVQAWREAQAVNVEAPLFTTIALLPLFFDQTRILFVGSASSDRPRKGWGAYCCGKSALLMAYRCLREEWEGERIAICSAKPGPVNTAIFEKGSQADREMIRCWSSTRLSPSCRSPAEVRGASSGVAESCGSRSASRWKPASDWRSRSGTAVAR